MIGLSLVTATILEIFGFFFLFDGEKLPSGNYHNTTRFNCNMSI